jgi:tetratricopeptide (TPR) repeat protein
MGSCSSKVRVNKGKAPAQPPQSRRNEGLGDLTRMDNRATALMKQGKLAEATKVNRQVLERSRTVLGPEHPDTLSRMFDLGLALHAGRRRRDAEQVFRQLLPLREKVLGPSHPDTFAAIDAICEELFNLRKYEECRELLEEELLRCKKAFGLEHQLTIRALSNMGNVYKMQGKLQDACSMYRTALEVSERVLGEAHQTTLGIRNDLQEMQEQNNLYETRKQTADTLKLRQLLAAKHGLPIPADPFTTTKSMGFSQLLDMYDSVNLVTTTGPEAAAAAALRIAETTRHPLSAPEIIRPYYTVEAKSTAVPGPSQSHATGTAV